VGQASSAVSRGLWRKCVGIHLALGELGQANVSLLFFFKALVQHSLIIRAGRAGPPVPTSDRPGRATALGARRRSHSDCRTIAIYDVDALATLTVMVGSWPRFDAWTFNVWTFDVWGSLRRRGSGR
jgi:hypothetical protein